MEKKEKNSLFSIGQKNPEKIKREIDFEVKPKHIFYFILFIMFICVMVIKSLSFLGVYDVVDVGCTDGSREKIEYQKTIYCGEDYTTLQGRVSEKSFEKVQNKILWNITS